MSEIYVLCKFYRQMWKQRVYLCISNEQNQRGLRQNNAIFYLEEKREKGIVSYEIKHTEINHKYFIVSEVFELLLWMLMHVLY